MKKLNFVVSLTTNDNDYQMEQAAAASETARRLGIDLQLIYAENDSILQSQQLLKIIQSDKELHPSGILFEPIGGTALPQVARAAAAAGIAWVVLNREVDYIADLRRSYRVPIFSVTSNHEEIGKIEGKQLGALLPNGGSALYIQGPSESLAAKLRTAGMTETKPENIQLKMMKGNWTEGSAYKSISAWLKLSTSLQTKIDVVAAQNDAMAVGAKKAFQELSEEAGRNRWLSLPYIGCDGVPKTGQAWVKSGLLAATVVNPANTGQAIEMLAHAFQTGNVPPERTFTSPRSFPSADQLGISNAEKVRTLAAKV
ncbi:MAG TPA: sugar ABC transporter substrate-binding protein [Terriglobales bacterium]|jgi:ribose transport system substrate-binding protein